MMDICNVVVERIALGEPIDEFASHVVECAACQRIVAMPQQLAAGHQRLRGASADPGLGFSARMTVAAQQRIGERRRNRLVGMLAASVAVASLAFFVVTRRSSQEAVPENQQAGEQPSPPIGPEIDDTPAKLDDADLAGLVRLADTRRARRVSAPWRKIEKPLEPYMQLVKGVTP